MPTCNIKIYNTKRQAISVANIVLSTAKQPGFLLNTSAVGLELWKYRYINNTCEGRGALLLIIHYPTFYSKCVMIAA